MSDWLTAEEAAIPLRCSTPTVTKMAKNGQFTKVKWAGNQVRIHRSEVYPEAEPTQISTPDPAPVLRLVAEIEQRLTELRDMIDPPLPPTAFGLTAEISKSHLLPEPVSKLVWGFSNQG